MPSIPKHPSANHPDRPNGDPTGPSQTRTLLSIVGAVIGIIAGVLSVWTQLFPDSGTTLMSTVLFCVALFLAIIILYVNRESQRIQSLYKMVSHFADRSQPFAQVAFLVGAILVTCLTVWMYWIVLTFSEATTLDSTQYVQDYPDNVFAIATMLDSVESKLVVAVDYAQYARFSNPKRFFEYRRAIDRKLEDKKGVSIVLYNNEVARKAALEQFGISDTSENDGKETFAKFKQSEKFQAYYEHHPEDMPDTPEEWADDIVRSNQAQAEEWRQKGADIRWTDERLPIFMWIRDENREAIFSLYNLGEEARERSFRTKNPNLIAALQRLFQDAFSRGAEKPCGNVPDTAKSGSNSREKPADKQG